MTEVTIDSKLYPTIAHDSSLMSLGSCFAENMGRFLSRAKFCCNINPYGILYNPLSIYQAVDEIVSNRCYEQGDLFQYRSLWNSWMHHGSFSGSDVDAVLENINGEIAKANKAISEIDVLLITFGTAWVYRLKESGKVVSNCHKVPSREFVRERLCVDEIVSTYSALLERLAELNPKLKVVFSISPIRHLKDGAMGNQLSKSILVLAVHNLCTAYPDRCSYFPSYEIVLDELRDYRFYNSDLVHPSDLAIAYIWERFKKAFFSSKTVDLMKKCEKIAQGLQHRPLNPNTGEYTLFLEHLVDQMELLMKKNPTLDFRKEIDKCHILLKR